MQTTGSLYGITSGLRSGQPTGYASASVGAAGLANQAGAFGQHTGTNGQLVNGNTNVGAGLGVAGGLLGVYSGIKQGGVAGYGQAGVGALGAGAGAATLAGNSQLASQLGGAAGYAAIPLAAYNEIANWKSGDTAGDAIAGAETGAAIGTAVMPVLGTAIGAVIGGAAGAISSAFGNGKVDPENANFNQYTQTYNKVPAAQQSQVAAAITNPYLPLAGYFDLRSNQVGANNPVYSTYGRMGEQKFTNDLISKVQQGKTQGISDPTQMWNNVVQPWINSMGNWNDPNKNAMIGLMQNMTGQVMAGTYKQNFKATGGDSPFKSG